jgi:hypothetical protein
MKKLFSGAVGTVFWLSTAGMMTIHIGAFFFTEQSLTLTILGCFIPPLGIANAVSFIATAAPITQYF